MTDKGLMLPGEDYVVVPLLVRDRIVERLRSTEEQATWLIRQLHSTQMALGKAWVEIERLRQYEPRDFRLAR
jgi:hypothetical protein